MSLNFLLKSWLRQDFSKKFKLMHTFLFLGQGQDFIDDTILDGFEGAHEEVALGIALDALERLTGVMLDNLVQHIAGMQNFTRMNIDVCRLSGNAAMNQRLMYVN